MPLLLYKRLPSSTWFQVWDHSSTVEALLIQQTPHKLERTSHQYLHWTDHHQQSHTIVWANKRTHITHKIQHWGSKLMSHSPKITSKKTTSTALSTSPSSLHHPTQLLTTKLLLQHMVFLPLSYGKVQFALPEAYKLNPNSEICALKGEIEDEWEKKMSCVEQDAT